MKKFVVSMIGLFVISLGIVMGVRMSVDAMAVIIGIIFGLVATIPTTILLIYVLRQRDAQQVQLRQQPGHYPPVVVVNSPPANGFYGQGVPNYGNQGMLPAGERSFKVVGQESSQTETLSEAFNLGSIWDE